MKENEITCTPMPLDEAIKASNARKKAKLAADNAMKQRALDALNERISNRLRNDGVYFQDTDLLFEYLMQRGVEGPTVFWGIERIAEIYRKAGYNVIIVPDKETGVVNYTIIALP